MASPAPRATRALLRAPQRARAGEVVEISLLIQHPMETGYRLDADGRPMPRDLLRRVECHFEGELAFAADLHAAIAANPYLAFSLRVQAGGTLRVTWQGDNGFAHSETATIALA